MAPTCACVPTCNPRPPFPTLVREHAFELAIIALWIVVQVFESHGGRASSLAADSAPLLTRLGTSASLFAKTLLGVKKRYLLLFVIAVVIWVVVVKKTGADRSPRAVDIVRLGLALLLTTIYLWLLGATTDPENLRRPDAVFGTLFFLLMFIVLPFGYLVSTHRQINVCLPILLFVMACSAPISYQCCTPAFQADIDPALAKSIGDDIVEQVIQASERGDELVDVAVPNMSYVGCPKPGRIPNALVANSESYVPDEGNWPLVNSPRESPSGVGVALYRHGIISKPIAVYFVKDVRVNEKYGIPVLTE